MSSNINNKALKNIRFSQNFAKDNDKGAEISENLKSSFESEFRGIVRLIESQKLIATNLYDFLNQYENNLPELLYYRNLLDLGKILLENNYVLFAKYQCYERILVRFAKMNLSNLIHISTVKELQILFDFSDIEFVDILVSSIYGLCSSKFQEMCIEDSGLVSKSNQIELRHLFQLVQMMMQILMNYEQYAYLVYNGTIVIYEISQYAMKISLSKLVVEYLIWACSCLELCVPLLTIQNLNWRATLYCTASQALINCTNYTAEAESFAKRGLSQIQELVQVYTRSCEAKTKENAHMISEAIITIGVSIFKVNAVESRRRPKSYLRPKTKINFKEVLQLNWPRTGTEKLLVEMFDSPSQQILAVLEAMKQITRPLGQCAPSAAENDFDILDVFSELFYASLAIIQGKCDPNVKSSKITEIKFNISEENQLDLAIYKGVEASRLTIFKLLCWAYTYGNWEFWDSVYSHLEDYLKQKQLDQQAMKSVDLSVTAQLKTIQLLQHLKKVQIHNKPTTEKKNVKLAVITEEKAAKDTDSQHENNRSQMGSASSKETKSSKSKRQNSNSQDDQTDDKQYVKAQTDPLLDLTNFINFDLLDLQFHLELYNREILVETGALLWLKIKAHFQSFIDGSLDNIQVDNLPHMGKWCYMLFVTHKLMTVIEFSQLNPVSYAEISLRLGFILEEISFKPEYLGNIAEKNRGTEDMTLDEFLVICTGCSGLHTAISLGCSVVLESILKLDIVRAEYSKNQQGEFVVSSSFLAGRNTLENIYLEINSVFLRQTIREMKLFKYSRADEQVDVKEIIHQSRLILSNKNSVLQALFLVNFAVQMKAHLTESQIKTLIQKVHQLIDKVLKEQEKPLNTLKLISVKDNDDRLPAPIVLHKGSNFVVLGINPNFPKQFKDKIAWIRLYGRAIDTPNAEVRLTDDKLFGTGVETCNFTNTFKVHGLRPNEMYLFAYCAIDKYGNLLGRGIGHSTEKILSVDHIDVIYAVNLICQLFYKLGLMSDVGRYNALIWQHFIQPNTSVVTKYSKTQPKQDELHQVYKMKSSIIELYSPMALRHFCLYIMSYVDAQRCLYSLDDWNYKSNQTQMAINKEKMLIDLCDKLLCLLPICKKLKDTSLSIEVFVTCCYLMVPVMHSNRFYWPFVQILEETINYLYALPRTTWLKISKPMKTTSHHLLACCGRYILKYYQLEELQVSCVSSNNKTSCFNSEIENIRASITLLLQMTSNVPYNVQEQEETTADSGIMSRLDTNQPVQQSANEHHDSNKKLHINKTRLVTNNDSSASAANQTSQQLAFETYKNMIGQQYDHQLSGSEDPDIIFSILGRMTSKQLYKEVVKFSRKTKYVQYVVEVMQQAIAENNNDLVLIIYRDIRDWIRKRNDTFLGKFNAAAADNNINEQKSVSDNDSLRKSTRMKKKSKVKNSDSQEYVAINVKPNMTELERQKQQELEVKAIKVLNTTMIALYKQHQRRIKFRQCSDYELPSRVRMNTSLGLAYIGLAQSRIDSVVQIMQVGYQLDEIPEIIDISQIFFLDAIGKIIDIKGTGPFIEATTQIVKMTKPQPRKSFDAGRTFRSESTTSDKKLLADGAKYISQWSDYVTKSATAFKRASVLAERGQLWNLLMTNIDNLWTGFNYLMYNSYRIICLIEHAKKELPGVDWSFGGSLITLDRILQNFSLAYFYTSEALLDMVEVIQISPEKSNDVKYNKNLMDNVILRAIHLLNYSNRPEKLIHLAIRFTILTKYQYFDLTHKIVSDAQSKLKNRIQKFQETHNEWKLTQSQYLIIQCLNQLKLNDKTYESYFIINKSIINRTISIQIQLNELDQLVQSNDKESHESDLPLKNLLSVLEANKERPPRFSVPLDLNINESQSSNSTQLTVRVKWKMLNQKKQYYLFGLHFNEKLDLTLAQLLKEYNTFNESLKTYTKNPNYQIMALRDIGDLLSEHNNKFELAIEYWMKSINCVVKPQFSRIEELHSWLDGITVDKTYRLLPNVRDCQPILELLGLNKCLHLATLFSRLAKNSGPNEDHIDIIVKSACLFKCIFSCSLSHPHYDQDFFRYYIMENETNPQMLLAHVIDPMFINLSEFNIHDIESQLWFIINQLVERKYLQFVVPLLCLYEHVVFVKLRNPQKVLQIQMIKLDVAIQMNQLSVASQLLFHIMVGAGLPAALDNAYKMPVTKPLQLQYQSDQHILHENNLNVIDKILSRRLNSNLAQRYGSIISTKISVLQSQFILTIAENIPVAPEYPNMIPENKPLEPKLITPMKKVPPKKTEAQLQNEEELNSVLEQVSSQLKLEKFTELPLNQLKGVLLSVATNICQPLVEEHLISIENEHVEWKMSSAAAVSTVHALLCYARALALSYCNYAAARVCVFADQLLNQYDEVFTGSNVGTINDADILRNRQRANFSLHLECQRNSIENLLAHVNIGNIIGSTYQPRIPDIPPSQALILSVIGETEQHCRHEDRAVYLSFLSQLCIQSGYQSDKHLAILHESIDIFESCNYLSDQSRQILIECYSRLINIQLTLDPQLIKPNQFSQTLGLVLHQIDRKYPQSIIWYEALAPSNEVRPATDIIYSSVQVVNTYDISMYRSYVLLIILYCDFHLKSPQMLQTVDKNDLLILLNKCLDVERALDSRSPDIEIEILLILGRLQRQMMRTHNINGNTVLVTFNECMKLVVNTSNHIGLIKQLLLEMILTMGVMANNKSCCNDNGQIVAEMIFQSQKSKHISSASSGSALVVSESDSLRKLTWLAMRSVMYLTACLKQLSLLKNDTTKLVDQELVAQLPNLVLFDLYAPYLLGTRKIIYKNEIELELSRMPESRIAKDSELLDNQIQRMKASIGTELSWSHILAYQENIAKLINNNFLAHKQSPSSIVRNLFVSPLLLEKQRALHYYIITNLTGYATNCVALLPNELAITSSAVSSHTECHLDRVEHQLAINQSNYNTQLQQQQLNDEDYTASKWTLIGLAFANGILPERNSGAYSCPDQKSLNKLEKIDTSDSELSVVLFQSPYESHVNTSQQIFTLFAVTQKITKVTNKLEATTTGWRLLNVDIQLFYSGLLEQVQSLDLILQGASSSSDSTTSASKAAVLNVVTGQTGSSNTKQSSKLAQQQMQQAPFIQLNSSIEMSDIEYRLRVQFDKLAGLFAVKSTEYKFVPPSDLITKLPTNGIYTILEPGVKIKPIPFEITRDSMHSLLDCFNGLTPKPINTNLALVAFVWSLVLPNDFSLPS